VLAYRIVREKETTSFFMQRLKREQQKQKAKLFFCEENKLPNINYILDKFGKIYERKENTQSVVHIICVGRTADYYRFFDQATASYIKSDLHNTLSKTLSPSIIGLFEDKYIVLIFTQSSVWRCEQILEQQQLLKRTLPSEKTIKGKLLPFEYAIASMDISSRDLRQSKDRLFRRIAFAMSHSMKQVDGLYIYRDEDYNRNLMKRATIHGLHQDIRQGGDQFELYLQPICYSLNTSQVYAAEVLLRWKRSVYGGPGVFMPLAAHEPPLHYSLTLMIINKVVRFVSKLEHNFPNVSINISNSDLSIMDFYTDVMSATENMPELRSKIIFEMVEYCDFFERKHTLDNLLALKQAGFRFAIDDFGSGYSSFSLLSKKYFDFIKLDKSLVKNSEKDVTARETLKFMVKLCELIGVGLIIEGVEEASQMKFLPKKSHVYLQGYLLSRPKKMKGDLALNCQLL
jgi:EAL domain-containing protein (putative c-di-GMP-specific phosphodiesterase class I)